MIDISSFVLRWMFLSNLCRDISDIQNLPSILHNIAVPSQPPSIQPNTNHHGGNNHNPNDYHYQLQPSQQITQHRTAVESHYLNLPPPPPPPTAAAAVLQWRTTNGSTHPNTIDGVVVDHTTTHTPADGLKPSSSSYHPNPTQQSHERQSLSHPQYHHSDHHHHQPQQQQQQPYTNSPQLHRTTWHKKLRDEEADYKEQCWRGILSYPPNCIERNIVINHLRADLVQQLQQRIQHDTQMIQQYKRNAVQAISSDQNRNSNNNDTSTIRNKKHLPPDTTTTSTTTTTTAKDETSSSSPTLHDYIVAKRSLLLFRNYLPQLVSVILKSPPPLHVMTTTTTAAVLHKEEDEDTMMHMVDVVVNPIQQLRHIVLTQCVYDASIGIELCWLLEAEVGRAWKTLFEHRQKQSGRRLIIVLPADKAIVLAKIGMEKREAFDLLQDTEQATAFGYTESSTKHNLEHSLSPEATPISNMEQLHSNTRLPSSLSVRRCSHFGDTMHFIDRLSKISSDLRMIPAQYRYNVLHDNLHELNRRLRRRMVSRGDISLDEDDNRSPYDWPHIEDMSVDMISHSVHLPLIPQIQAWCNGEVNQGNGKLKENHSPVESQIPNTEVVRVLNIVVHEAKLLSSRERCPFLIHVEVADSGLEGNDARLYTTGMSDIGSTIGEALGMMSTTPNLATATYDPGQATSRTPPNMIPYSIPDELLPHIPIPASVGTTNNQVSEERIEHNAFIRGGSQNESPYYDSHDVMTGEYMIDPFDLVRQQDYEQLHQHLHAQRSFETLMSQTVQKISVGGELLDNVFGREWRDKCKEIRDVSPYGHIKGWRLASFIMKAGEDIRRESFVMQIISKLQSWFMEEIPEVDRPFMRPYTIMCVGGDAGLLECLSDAKSVDEVKKRTDGFTTLRDYFERAYGPPRRPAFIPPSGMHNEYNTRKILDPFGVDKNVNAMNGRVSFETAQDNFLRSLVGYSLVCYILQIKDRHNANILLDRLGHIMHIDFGYVLGDTPKMGKVPIFSERAPFKLSSDFWDVLGGWNMGAGGLGVKFCKMFELAFQCASSHADEIAALTEAAVLSLHSNPRHARSLANGVRSRLRMRGAPASREQKLFIMELVNAALTSWGTSTYDWLQRNMNGYQ